MGLVFLIVDGVAVGGGIVLHAYFIFGDLLGQLTIVIISRILATHLLRTIWVL